MKNIDQELISFVETTIEKEYKDDVALLIGQYGACKIPTDEQKMSFDYFVPATERGYCLAETFIIEDMGYDLYPMSFERLEQISNFMEPRMIWVLDKSEILYARNEKDRNRFNQIKEHLYENFQNPKKTLPKAIEFVEIAMEIYSTMLFEENMCKIRKAAGGIAEMLISALSMINGSVIVSGCGIQISDISVLKKKPETFLALYKEMIDASGLEEIQSVCKKMIKSVRIILQKEKSDFKEKKEHKNNDDGKEDFIHYEDLAFWYQEMRYTFRKIEYYATQNDVIQCYSIGCYLQIEFDAIQDEFQLAKMELMSSFYSKNLAAFKQKANEIEEYLVKTIKNHHVKINSYNSLEDFLKCHH